MIAPREIIHVIQSIPENHSSMRFLISLADGCFKYGALTAKQEAVFCSTVETLKSQGVLA